MLATHHPDEWRFWTGGNRPVVRIHDGPTPAASAAGRIGGGRMLQFQPSTATLEAAFTPAAGRKTATGVTDTISEANLWERKTFTTELQWGVRYSQSDPLGKVGESHPYLYAMGSPLRLIDENGLKSLCVDCNAWDKEVMADRLRQVADFQSGQLSPEVGLPPQMFSDYPTGITRCGGHQEHAGGVPTTDYSNLGTGDCADACTRAHEQVHRDNCRRVGYNDPPFIPQYGMDDPDEAFGYLAEYECLKQALLEGKVTVDVDPIGEKNR